MEEPTSFSSKKTSHRETPLDVWNSFALSYAGFTCRACACEEFHFLSLLQHEFPMRAIQIRISQGARILDFGCGTGWFLAEAQASGDPLRIGIDNSLESLAGLNGVPTPDPNRANPVHLVSGDGLKLPFLSESFDVVVGHVSMPYMDTRGAFCEIYRVLAPGGSFFLTFHNFLYLRKRLTKSFISAHWKDVVYMFYVGANGLLNHLDLPQTQVWWKRSKFETVNTRHGVDVAASRAGFSRISAAGPTNRIFFHATGYKQSQEGMLIAAPEVIYPD